MSLLKPCERQLSRTVWRQVCCDDPLHHDYINLRCAVGINPVQKSKGSSLVRGIFYCCRRAAEKSTSNTKVSTDYGKQHWHDPVLPLLSILKDSTDLSLPFGQYETGIMDLVKIISDDIPRVLVVKQNHFYYASYQNVHCDF